MAEPSYGAGFISGRWQFTFTQAICSWGFVHQPFEHNDFGFVTTSYAF
ncbi:MAG: hypothetical protein ACOZE5_11550 [Verrucomicrobiota bacterium]